MKNSIYFTTVPSPIQTLYLIYDNEGAIESIFFADTSLLLAYIKANYTNKRIIQKDLSGKDMTKKSFLFHHLSKYSSFQRDVWEQTYRITSGQTLSYSKLAHLIGNGKAARAVGNALHNNPLPYLIPCHRVIAKNNVIGNYALGTEMKRFLLTYEGVTNLH